jgi:hypothetical protein
MMTTIVLFRGLKAPASQIITLVMGFLVICLGITILQMSKVDPEELAAKNNLDRRSTLLLHAARQHTVDAADEKSLAGIEDPGMDALRGSFGTFGSIMRARSARRMSLASSDGRPRVGGTGSFRATGAGLPMNPRDRVAGLAPDLERHQLFDPPMPVRRDSDAFSLQSRGEREHERERKQTIKFGAEDVVHEYRRSAARGADDAVHTSRPSALAASPRGGGASSSSLSLSLTDSLGSGSAVVSSDGSARTTAGSGTASTVSGLPSVVYERSLLDGLRTAPAGAASVPYFDPFAGSPGTATGAAFADADTDVHRAHRKERPTHARINSSRSYPRGDRADDAEESLRLVNDAGSDASEDDEHRKGGIRLVKRF